MSKKFLFVSTTIVLATVFITAFSDSKTKLNRFSAENKYSDTLYPAALMARDHKGKSITSSRGVISLTSGLDNDYYLLDSTGRTGFLYIETKLEKFINERSARVPLNLSVVIDRSGSMSGEKMEFAKKAAIDIIHKLTPDDFVSIVIYDDKVELLQPSVRVTDKFAIITKVKQIETGGSTNLWGGAEKGFEQVKAGYKKNYVNRVLLISDGLANAGITSIYEIRKRVLNYKDNDGITLSTFGVGLDYNELLMTDMAEAGNGNYYFIESPDKMAALFDKELNGLLNVAAQNAELKIKLPRGVKLQKAFAFKHMQNSDEIVVSFRDLFSEETKGLLMKFSIDDYANVPLKFISTLTYDDVTDNQRKFLRNENILTPAGNNELYLTHFNEGVIQQTVLYVANENMERAMLEADKGNYDNARKLISANKQYLSANAGYVTKSEELQKMDSVNTRYSMQLKEAETLDADGVKQMQKSNRSESYKIRGKKTN